MEQFIQHFAQIYFWVFIAFTGIQLLTWFGGSFKDFQTNKQNAIKNGTWKSSIRLEALLIVTLFALSCYYK